MFRRPCCIAHNTISHLEHLTTPPSSEPCSSTSVAARQPQSKIPSADIMPSMVRLHASAENRAVETPRPDANDDRCCRPSTKLPIFYVNDKNTHTHFLVDTRSEVSVIPPSTIDRRCSPNNLTLTAVKDTPISTYSQRTLTLNLDLTRSLPWIFIVADVQQPILGVDFIRHFSRWSTCNNVG